MKERLVLVGGGGHAKVVIDAVRKQDRFNIYGLVDPNLKKGDFVLGIPVLGDDSILPEIHKKIKNAFISVGSTGDYTIRRKLYDKIKKIGFKIPVICHPTTVIAQDIKIGEGTFLAALTVVNPGSRIGRNVILNTGASIDHDCSIGDFVHIAPGAVLSGNVKVSDGIHIGTGAKITQDSVLDSSIGDHRKVKANSLVYYSKVHKATYVIWPFGSHEAEDGISI